MSRIITGPIFQIRKLNLRNLTPEPPFLICYMQRNAYTSKYILKNKIKEIGLPEYNTWQQSENILL